MKIKKMIKRVGRFVMTHKALIIQLGIMGYIVATGDVASANTSGGGDLSVVVSPLKKIQETISGPIATTVGTAGAGLLGLSVAMNFENQIAKRAIQGAGGIGLGVGGAQAVSAFGAGLLLL